MPCGGGKRGGRMRGRQVGNCGVQVANCRITGTNKCLREDEEGGGGDGDEMGWVYAQV
jgi:hypothetical protein